MPERTSEDIIFGKIEELLSQSHLDGVAIIKKGKFPNQTQRLLDGMNNYFSSMGYTMITREDSGEYHVSIMLKS